MIINGKIDEIKEILNTLRVGLSLVIGLVVITTGALINKEQLNQIDVYFWIGIVFDCILLIVFIKIVASIKKHTREIKPIK